MTKSVFGVALALMAVQPVAAIQTVQLESVANAPTAADCPANAGGRTCPLQTAAPTGETATALDNGVIISGLAGLLILGLIFGRRKHELQEVVS